MRSYDGYFQLGYGARDEWRLGANVNMLDVQLTAHEVPRIRRTNTGVTSRRKHVSRQFAFEGHSEDHGFKTFEGSPAFGPRVRFVHSSKQPILKQRYPSMKHVLLNVGLDVAFRFSLHCRKEANGQSTTIRVPSGTVGT